MLSGFAGRIGRWYRRRTDESMPVQKGVVVTSPHPDMPGPCKYFTASGPLVDAQPYLQRPETFEGMVGFDNLCLIARAADNLEAMLGELELVSRIKIKAVDDDSGALVCGALQELKEALLPYRVARKAYRL